MLTPLDVGIRRLPPRGVAVEAEDELEQRYFADIAQDVVDSVVSGTQAWGDRLLRESALHGGPGDSSQWIAIGMSHHIAHLAAHGSAAGGSAVGSRPRG